jgi:hypothetical protein
MLGRSNRQRCRQVRETPDLHSCKEAIHNKDAPQVFAYTWARFQTTAIATMTAHRGVRDDFTCSKSGTESW